VPGQNRTTQQKGRAGDVDVLCDAQRSAHQNICGKRGTLNQIISQKYKISMNSQGPTTTTTTTTTRDSFLFLSLFIFLQREFCEYPKYEKFLPCAKQNPDYCRKELKHKAEFKCFFSISTPDEVIDSCGQNR
jgi:hypothetical protein